MPRAEDLKKTLTPSPTTPKAPPGPKVDFPSNKPYDASGRVVPPLGFGAFADSDDDNDDGGLGGRRTVAAGVGSQVQPPAQPRVSASSTVNVGPGGYTKEEIDVLRYATY